MRPTTQAQSRRRTAPVCGGARVSLTVAADVCRGLRRLFLMQTCVDYAATNLKRISQRLKRRPLFFALSTRCVQDLNPGVVSTAYSRTRDYPLTWLAKPTTRVDVLFLETSLFGMRKILPLVQSLGIHGPALGEDFISVTGLHHRSS